MAVAKGNNNVDAPPEIIEIGLMEKFHWTPMEIAQIPLGTLQRLFVAMNQREKSQEAAASIESKRKEQENKNKTAKPTRRK